MAEGGVSFKNPAYDPYNDPYDDYDDDEANVTTPFLPQTSTPHSHGGENIKCRQCNKSHLGCHKNLMSRPVLLGQKQVKWPGSLALWVSYNTKDRLQVKMFGAGKKLYSLTKTERGTGIEVINKSLPKEIKTALGPSKYERLEKITSDKRRELKESEVLAAQREKNKKDMEEKTEALEKARKDLEDLKNAEVASPRKIEKVQAKVRTLEAEEAKARDKYLKSVDAEKNKTSVEEDINATEDIQEED